eukprot:maker-scaffold_9-snap-gene-10.5-mRNA-1 protein AED:0.01 eAED:0.01 QI:1587/1/1/1/0/0/2/76/106
MTLTLVGKVVSNAMQKSIVVQVPRYHYKPKIKAKFYSFKKFIAHDEHEICRVGDEVRIKSCRPLSKRKHFTLDEKLKDATEDYHKGKEKISLNKKTAREGRFILRD